MNKMYKSYSTRRTPQSEKIPGTDQVQNRAGGFAWAVDDWTRLDRFLVLGTEGGTYYVKERELTHDNAEAVMRCIQKDGVRVVQRVVEISEQGRAVKNDPALFALAMAAGTGDLDTRQAAFVALPRVARIGTHLFHFAEYVEQFRGWGRALRNGVADWYNRMDAGRLAYQTVKYQARDGWSHRDLLRLAHPTPTSKTHDAIYHWITQGWDAVGDEPHPDEDLRLIWAFERAKRADERETIRLINEYGLTREMVRTDHLNSIGVWEALLQKMPLTAMIRNLGKMTAVGLIKPLYDATRLIAERLGDGEYLRRSRVHPLSLLVALNTYGNGHGARGSLTWAPVPCVLDALDAAFYLSFGNVEPTGKRIMLALDVSGSMTGPEIAGLPGISPRVGSAAMALITANAESDVWITGFTATGKRGMKSAQSARPFWGGRAISDLAISPRQRLDDVARYTSDLPFSRTDCALPMLYATELDAKVDAFVVYTDSETWAGGVHPHQALVEYRQKSGLAAKMVVVGMVSNKFSIADPHDPGELDVVGFDTATPQAISEFLK